MAFIKEKGKYYPLYEFLIAQQKSPVCLTFLEIEKIIGKELPQSAYKHQAWWGNTRSGTYIQSAAWLEAGFRVDTIDFGKKIEFSRVSSILLTKKRSKSGRRLQLENKL